ncbi:MAG: serine/threonine protein kinase [Chroococcidiopsidaceae cyanobacterium CP_BM_ER_R8_30]|nr:serine/threonine protein kinase [Chroococcidiopsidaceae cyanobacterium CP_BM_ER_R8_30]
MPEAEIAFGTFINHRYRIQRVLGEGGFGRIYLASDEQRFGELCVLKEFIPISGAESTVQKSRILLEREAKVLYEINHPQIPKFMAWFAHMGRLFLVQEYIDGKTYSHLLHERLSRQNNLFSEAEVTQWLKDLLPVLDYLHERHIIHRDISPDNIMLAHGQSRPVLIDFGLVKQTVAQILAINSETLSNPGQSFVGKFGYAPPEQIRLGQCYPCSDLYSLGVSAVVLLSGKEPSLLLDQRSLEWQWHSYVKISEDLAQILNKMLAEKPKDRYQSAQEVLAELQLIAGADVPTPLMDLHLIEIDQTKKERQVAEIAEADYFRQLQREAKELRDSFTTNSETRLNAEIPQLSLPEATTAPKLNPAFVDRCQQELARIMGPVARYILVEALAQQPDISPLQLVEALVAAIPNPQQAQKFRNSVKTSPDQPKSRTSQRSTTSGKTAVGRPPESVRASSPILPEATMPPQLNPAFVDRCRKELARVIGPIAKYILADILAQHPEISPLQLVEALVAEIPNPQQAIEFRQRLLL